MLCISKQEYGSLTLDTFNIASSAASSYTPLIVHQYKEYVLHIGTNIEIYHKPLTTPNREYNTFRLNNFFEYLNSGLKFARMIVVNKDKSAIIYVGKGCIQDADGKLLLMLSVKAGKEINYSRYYNSPAEKEQAENMTLFVSTELMINSIYANFYKKLHKGYIEEAFKIDLPVIYTTSDEIERLHYSNDFKVEFNQISDFENHLKNNVGRIFKMSNEDFETFNPGIGKDFQEVIPVPEVEELLSGSGARVLQQVFDESFREQFVTGSSNIRISNDGTLLSVPAFTDNGSQLLVEGTGEILVGSGEIMETTSPATQLEVSDGTISVYDHTVNNYIVGMDSYLSDSVVAPVISNIQEVIQDFDFVDDTEDSVEF